MNPLQALKDLISPPETNTVGTVVGSQGRLTLLRTPQGIKLVDASNSMRGATVTLDSRDKVISSQPNDNVIPSYKV